MGRILLVGDHVEERVILENLFQDAGHQVESASNGVQALEIAVQSPPSAVVSDILMSEMDGFTFCRHWRQHDQLGAIPFVFCTGTFTDPRDEQFALRLGADGYLIRSEAPSVIVSRVESIMLSSGARDRSSSDGSYDFGRTGDLGTGPDSRTNHDARPYLDQPRLTGSQAAGPASAMLSELDPVPMRASLEGATAPVRGTPPVPDLSSKRASFLSQQTAESTRSDPADDDDLARLRRVLLNVLEDQKLAENYVRAQVDELKRWQVVTLEREARLVELKREVNELLAQLHHPQRYAVNSESPVTDVASD